MKSIFQILIIGKVFVISIAPAFAFFVSCNSINRSVDKPIEKKWSDLPEVVSVDNLTQTEFVPTLENEFPQNKNIIYAPAFLYAWDTLRTLFSFPITISDSNTADFTYLNNSNTYYNSLNRDEYHVNCYLDNGVITAEAYFNKTLPFSTPLQKADATILFNKEKVACFGMYDFDHEITRFTKILYYENDDRFIIELIPQDTLHQIILAMGIPDVKSLIEAVGFIKQEIAVGEKERKTFSNAWKYSFNNSDILSIPSIRFNIGAHYKNLEGQTFSVNGQKYLFLTAYQRTALILNENGAVVESFARAAADTAMTEKPQPKKLIFDKTFFILIKRVDRTNPYFVMKVDNTELLIKEKETIE
ncbi:MAG: hypothetical protein JNN00_19095 [Chitinophagaceae bacterium]|nr:hypothetical protein [Chitinophagaceae bacterium]